MAKEILINIDSKETRCAFLKNGLLHDLIIERSTSRPLTGNVYRGYVVNTLQEIRSSFVNIGEEKNGFIPDSDILENIQKFQETFGMDFEIDLAKVHPKKRGAGSAKLFKPDQPVLVQVVKEPTGSKGARLTSNISIPGRHLVLIPNTSIRVVSRKMNAADRERLQKLIQAFEMPQDMGLICRTASANASEQQLVQEAHDLLATWKEIMEKFEKSTKPTCLFEESDLIKRTLLAALDKQYQRILVDHPDTLRQLRQLQDHFGASPDLRIELYRDKIPMFERFGVERELDKALLRKVLLPSGGSLFFDATEAMLTIDVNSGRSKSKRSTSDLEESLVQINMQAADEIARQLRIRNIGGIIVCDFIDMKERKNKKRVLERLKEAVQDDTAKCTFSSMSELGLVEMVRRRYRESLSRMMYTSCSYCHGIGLIKTHETVSIEIERCLKKLIQQEEQYALRLVSHPTLDHFLTHQDKPILKKLAEKLNADLKFAVDDNLHMNEFQFYSTTNGKLLDI